MRRIRNGSINTCVVVLAGTKNKLVLSSYQTYTILATDGGKVMCLSGYVTYDEKSYPSKRQLSFYIPVSIKLF